MSARFSRSEIKPVRSSPNAANRLVRWYFIPALEFFDTLV